MSSYGMYNQGLNESEKPTSRVLRPPGGSTSFNIFGGGDPQPTPTKKTHSASPTSQQTEVTQVPKMEQKTSVNPTPPISDPIPLQTATKPSGKRTSSKVLAPPGGKSNIFIG